MGKVDELLERWTRYPSSLRTVLERELIATVERLETEIAIGEKGTTELLQCINAQGVTVRQMSDILERTAVALNGPEPKDAAWAWGDLPKIATAAARVARADRALSLATAAFEAAYRHEGCQVVTRPGSQGRAGRAARARDPRRHRGARRAEAAVNRLAPLMASGSGEWQTPAAVLELVRQVAPIALDPCTTPSNPCDARAICVAPGALGAVAEGIDVGVDGLRTPWGAVARRAGDGLVYVNPPYGREIGRWTEQCFDTAQEDVEVLALLPARTDTRWWQGDCSPPEAAQAVCFWRGRLTFVGAPAPAPFPSCLVYWGAHKYRFAEVFSSVGRIWL